ncbi:HAD family hydrolase [Streptomyces sp. NPDC059070]|uniref:HAD family hydrolase n=1 Tax=Streptomyces sp. NPDC059070 TaxID=3346713 RepID=UPI0036774B09
MDAGVSAAPDPVHAALTESGAAPAQALLIGDALWDVQAAQAKVACVAVLTGGVGERALRAAGALEGHAGVGELLAHIEDSAFADPVRRTGRSGWCTR